MEMIPTRRERILVFGAAGVGKSTLWIAIMDHYHRIKSKRKFWIIDSDNAIEAIGLEGGKFDYLMPMVAGIWHPETFEAWKEPIETVREKAHPQDWVIADLINSTWDEMPDWWMAEVYGDDSWSYWVQTRKEIVAAEEAGRKGHEKQFGGTAGVDWNMIKKTYRGSIERPLIKYAPCHIICLAEEQEIDERHDKDGLKAHYARTSGIRPRGEKQSDHRYHTIMRMTRSISKTGRSVTARELTVHKDRGGREDKWEEIGGRGLTIPVTGELTFVRDYLIKVGGWKIGKGEE